MNTRKKLSASSEDYLEAIYNLASLHKVARCKDIADSLSVSKASVTGAVKLLFDKGLVDYKPYGYIYLTEKGGKEAAAVAKRHTIIEAFFVKVLGVDEQEAKSAACKAEHSLGQTTIPKLLSFTEFCTIHSNVAAEFQKFCQSQRKS
jgi:DtxR family transcriptional regulator, Mn-dependent transcriptional regulator